MKCPNCNDDIRGPVYKKRGNNHKWYKLVAVDMVCPVCEVKLVYSRWTRLLGNIGLGVWFAGSLLKLLTDDKSIRDDIGSFTVIIMLSLFCIAMLIRKVEVDNST